MGTGIRDGRKPGNRSVRAAILGLLLTIAFAYPSRDAGAVDVTIQIPETVPNTGVTKVTVTLSPSPSPVPVVLTVRSISRAGDAQFLLSRQIQVTVTETTTLDLVGTTLSQWEDNMLLDASVGGTMVAGARFSVVDPRMISFAQAIQLAREAIRGRVTTQRGAPITVGLSEHGYVVWFGQLDYGEMDRGLPTLRGTAITVNLDAFTGTLIKLLSSPG